MDHVVITVLVIFAAFFRLDLAGRGFYQSVRGIVNLKDCTITDNTGSYGGGIRVGGNDNDDWNASGLGTLNATNCTISRGQLCRGCR